MRIMNTASAVVLGLILGIAGFMIYHKETTLPFADALSTQTNIAAGQIQYQIIDQSLIITSNELLSGLIQLQLVYDPISTRINIDQSISQYEYSFGETVEGMITIYITGDSLNNALMQIPIEGDSYSVSMPSPLLYHNNTQQSLTISRLE